MKNYIPIVTGTVSGFLTRPCCSVPFFYSLFGLSASGVGSSMGLYEELFYVIAIISFTIGGHFTFRVRGAVFNKVFFIAGASVTIIFIFFPEIWLNGLCIVDNIF